MAVPVLLIAQKYLAQRHGYEEEHGERKDDIEGSQDKVEMEIAVDKKSKDDDRINKDMARYGCWAVESEYGLVAPDIYESVWYEECCWCIKQDIYQRGYIGSLQAEVEFHLQEKMYSEEEQAGEEQPTRLLIASDCRDYEESRHRYIYGKYQCH